MDILLLNASLYAVPTAQRADAIVYDGTVDLGLWRPPGPDRDLLHAYGDSLPEVLRKARAQLASGRLELGQALRLHEGKLRCDYLIWLGARNPHGETVASPAPALSMLERATAAALVLAGKHGAARVAFGAMFGGLGQVEVSERLAAVVRGAHAFRTAYLTEGKALSIEEVLVCADSAADIAKARRITASLSLQPMSVVRSFERSSQSQSSAPRTPSRRAGKQRLDEAALANARIIALAYHRGQSYAPGDWFKHPTLGIAQVTSVLGPERMLTALFEDGQERKLIHGR